MRPYYQNVKIIDIQSGVMNRFLDASLHIPGDLTFAAYDWMKVMKPHYFLLECQRRATGRTETILCNTHYPRAYAQARRNEKPAVLHLFNYDYAKMKRRNAPLRTELLTHVMAPANVHRLLHLGLL